MKHLEYLKYANYAMAAFYVLAGLLGAVMVLVAVVIPASQGGDPAQLIAPVIAAIVGFGVVFLLVALFVVTAGRVGQARGRILQTVLAVLTISSCPGIFYAIYALWVVWMNEETKAAFEENAG